NTGGKTVCLKLVGILSLMIASGIFAPCDGDSKLAIFDNVFCDIGDEQDIEQNLSTFSSHMTNLIYISNHVNRNCLLLLDELGGGTDPVEGSALAISLLEYFKNKGCKTITSTHYNELKEYAYAQSGVAVSGMDFDPQTFAPTYRLIMGHSASSNALEIASSLGLKKNIVDGARGRLSKEKLAFDNVIKGAEKSRRDALEYERKAKENYEISEKSTQEAKKALEELNEQKQKLEEKMRKSAKDLLSDYLEEAEDLLEELKEQVKKGDEQALFEARRLKKKLGDIRIEEQKPITKLEFLDGNIAVGDSVYVDTLEKVGEVQKINEKKREYQGKVGILTKNVKYASCSKVYLHTEK
ncbi:MAG: endonuclease MutS2, partial [Clostridia bacterium]|nr:endonuclease MutS2 [Clostridia bacterium]